MRQRIAMIAAFVVSGLVAGTGTAAAQSETRRVPDYGMVGVGVSFGAAIPNDESFNTGLTTSVEAERYVTPRLSVRALFGGNWNDIVNRGFSGTTTPVRLNGNVVYNWEGGKGPPVRHWRRRLVPLPIQGGRDRKQRQQVRHERRRRRSNGSSLAATP